MNAPHSFPRWPLYLSLFLFFVLTAALMARVPLMQSPDEAAHWQYVQNIAQTGELPVFRGAAPPAPGYEFHQPPLYYLLCAPLWNATGAGVQNYACRVVSMLCGLGTIWLIWSAAQLLFPRNGRIAALAALFAALLPLHQGVSAGSNNDGLAGLISAALFFLMARFWTQGLTWRDVWQVGIVAGLAVLTKNTLLTVVAAAFVALFLAANRFDSRVRVLPALGASLGLMLLIGGGWLLRNQNLYGDPLALSAFSKAAQSIGPGFEEFSQIGLNFFTYARALLWMIFLTTWGFFGGPNAAVKATDPLSLSRLSPGPRVPELWMLPLVLLCLLAPVLAISGARRARRDEEGGPDSPILPAAITPWLWAIALILLAWAQFGFNHFAGGQARYLHPALLPACVLGAAGWVGFWGQGRALKIASLGLGAAMIALTLLNVLVWKTLDR